MEETAQIYDYKSCLISKDNIILEADKDFLDLIGYRERDLLGKTLGQVGKLLRTDGQIDLQDLEDARVFIFTKELLAIEGKLSCESIDKGAKKIFSFKKDPLNSANQNFDLSNQLATSRGDGVAIFSFDSLILINSNKNHFNFLEPPYNERANSIGKNIREILSKNLYDFFSKMKSHVITREVPYYVEEVELRSSLLGETYWNVTLVPILENEKIKYLILYLSNETEKVINRKALEEKNEQLEAIIDNISDEILIFDKDSNITTYNKLSRKNAQLEDRKIKNLNDIMKDSIVFDKDDNLIANGNFPFQRIAQGEFIANYVMKIENSLGLTYREVSGSPIYDKNGDYRGCVIVYRDIDNRIQAEETRLIKAQNELLTKVVEALDLEYIRCTYPEFEIISINSKNFKKTQSRCKDINCPIGESYFTIYPIHETSKRKELDFYLIEKGEYSYIDYTSHIIDGEERFFKTINQPIFGLNNKIVEIIFITTDITDEVKARNKIEETLEMQNQMFATISHELKTPLNVIFSATQLIEMYLKKEIDQINKADISGSIDIIKQNSYRFIKLINNIIDLSRIESGFFKLNYRNKNIIEILEAIIDSVRSYVEDKGITIIFDTEIEERIMAVDIDKMDRIILNLISNAVKYSYEGGYIYIDIKDEEDFIEIQVRDHGVGIKENHLDTIFDKYKKLENCLVRNAEGSGIGLALVKQLTDLLDGEISVESEFGKGSTFTVRLPVRVLDEWEVKDTIKHSDNRIEKINIEFSDIYEK